MTTEPATTVIQHSVGPTGLLVARVPSGTLRLRGTDGDTVRVHAADPDDLARLHVERGEGSLSIAAHRDGAGRFASWRSIDVDLDIDVPAGASIVIEAASADIDASRLHGDQRYRTVSGGIRIRDVHGPIGAEAVSGDIDVVIDGPASLAARTVSGDLAVRAGDLDRLEAATTSGDVRIAGRLAGTGPFLVETVSGDATLAPAGPVRVQVATIAGDVHADVEHRAEGPRSRRTIEIGAGGPTLSFRSTSGDLRVVRATPVEDTGSAGEAPVESIAATAVEVAVVDPTPATDHDELTILRALERGEIDVEEARRKLAELEATEEVQ